jgi:eukaryotic-like serine/threonine-protein kinase
MAEIQAGTIIAGKYRLERALSKGGMGAVWLAHHLQLDAPVAVKFMHHSLVENPSARSRFEREAKAAAQIRSPHVVHVYDHGIDAGTPFIVMEYLEGGDLRARLRGKRRLPPAEAARVCDEVCKGLARAHKLGIVHRDLKPGNVFLSEPDEDMVKILDFGIAKETGDNRVVRGETTTGQLLGSPHYMSPEQARGQALDGRSDLWSLAVILFRALTGRRPFDGDDIGDLIVRICMDPVPDATSLAPELPSSADDFFHKAFNRDPAGRYQDARAFAEAFRAAVSGAVVVDRADSSGSASIELESPTLTPSSAKFGNMLGPIGHLASDEPPSAIGSDTLAAATTVPARGRARLVGGVIAMVAGGAVTLLVLMLREPNESAPAASAPQAQPEPQPATQPIAAAPSLAASQDEPPPPKASASSSARAKAKGQPPRPAQPLPPPAKPAPKPGDPLGY